MAKPIKEAASSQAQAQFFGLVRAVQKGDVPASKVTSNVRDAAKNTSPKDVADLTKPEKNAPSRVIPKGKGDKEDKKKDEAFEASIPNGGISSPEGPTGTSMEGISFFDVVGRYNEYGKMLRREHTLGELGQQLSDIAEYAEYALTNEAGNDWFDAHTIRRNIKEMKTYAKEFMKIAQEADTHQLRMSALYDDMGRVLERYFDIYDAEKAAQRPRNDNPATNPDMQHEQPPETGTGSEYPDEKYWKETGPEPGGSADSVKCAYCGSQTRNVATQVCSKCAAQHAPAADKYFSRPPHSSPKTGEFHGESVEFGSMTERAIQVVRSKLRESDVARFDSLPKMKQGLVAWRALS